MGSTAPRKAASHAPESAAQTGSAADARRQKQKTGAGVWQCDEGAEWEEYGHI